MGPSKIQEAEERLKAEAEKAPGAEPEKEKEMEDPEPVKKPEFVEELGFCRVGITIDGLEGTNHIVVVDPGFKKIRHIDGWSSEDPEEVGKAYLSIAKAIKEFKIPALMDFEELGVMESEDLPHPKTLVREHTNQWETWRQARLAVERKNLEGRRADPEGFIPELVEDPPETKLSVLLGEALPSKVFLMLLPGITWAVSPGSEKEGVEGN